MPDAGTAPTGTRGIGHRQSARLQPRALGGADRYLDDGAVPIDNNWVENQIRPWAPGRSNWLFAGSLRSGQRAAAIMSLIQSAKLNGHDPYAYLKDVLRRLPKQKKNAIEELYPHNWKPVEVGKV
jgi:hypothetical protein